MSITPNNDINLHNLTPFQNSEDAAASHNESFLCDFLQLNDDEKESKLQDLNFADELSEIIKNSDQTLVRDEETGNTLLHQFLESESKEVRALSLICLRSGAEVNRPNDSGLTSLHYAAFYSDSELIEEFLSAGAKQFPSEEWGTPFNLAVEKKSIPCATLLLSSTPNLSWELFFNTSLKFKQDLPKMLESAFKQGTPPIDAEQIWKCIAKGKSHISADVKSATETAALWLLENQAAKISPKTQQGYQDQSAVLSWMAKKVGSGKVSKQGEAILNALIKSDSISTIILDSNKWFLDKINHQIETKELRVSNKIQEEIEKLANDESYLELRQLSIELEETTDLKSQSEILDRLTNKFQELKEEKIPYVKLLEASFESNFPKIEEIKTYKKISTALENNTPLEACPNELYAYLVKESIKNSRWESIPRLQESNKIYKNSKVPKMRNIQSKNPIIQKPGTRDINEDLNKIAFHFLLDKSLIKEQKKYESSQNDVAGSAFRRAIKEVNQEGQEKLPTEIRELSKSVYNFLNPLMDKFIKIEQTPSWEKANYILKNLNEMKVGESLLIPSGVEDHATRLLMTKTSESGFKVLHYNTGDGIQNHHQWENSSHYQTFDEFHDIPIASITNPSTWNLLNDLFSSRDNEGIQLVYKTLSELLCKGGVRDKASDHEEDYEAIQLSGTCGIQSLMALLRHQIMDMTQGSPSEKEACYKVYKSALFKTFLENNNKELDQTIQNHVAPILEKVNAENETFTLARDPIAFQESFQQIQNALDKLGLSEDIEALKSRKQDTSLSRYATLRDASTKLSFALLKNPEAFSFEELKKEKAFSLAIAKSEHYSATIKNASNCLEEYRGKGNTKEYFSLLFRIDRNPPFKEFVFQVMEQVCTSDESLAEQLLEELRYSYGKEQGELYVNTLIERLEQKNPDHAEWVKSYWHYLNGISR